MTERFWTPARVATLKAQWIAGVAAKEIAGALGVSGSAVIGKARRLALGPHPNHDHSERMKKLLKKLNADPGFAARNSERMKKLNADPGFAARNSERMKKLNADPDFAARRDARNSERMKKLNADPDRAA